MAAADPDAPLGHGLIVAEPARRRRCRNALLFAGLAAEAYVNEFLAHHLGGKDLAAVDRLPAVEKYVIGTRLALGRPLWIAGASPCRRSRPSSSCATSSSTPQAGVRAPEIPL